MNHSVRRHLSVAIDEYDETIRRFIPGYDGMVEAVVDAVLSAPSGTILDLGAGTGTLSYAVLSRSAGRTVELLDVDPEMLTRARERLADFGPRARYRHASFDDPVPACGAAMACLALHHVPTLEAKRRLFRRVASALPAGGVLANADVALPVRSVDRDEAYRYWAHHQVSRGIPEAQAWANFESWAEEDTYFSLEEESEAMRAAGLQPKCVWRDGPMAVLVGRRPS